MLQRLASMSHLGRLGALTSATIMTSGGAYIKLVVIEVNEVQLDRYLCRLGYLLK